MPGTNSQISYIIDRDDRIVSVGGEWDAFAASNDAPELVSERVIDQKIWDFFDGESIRSIYRSMIRQVRTGITIDIDFRCDAPDRHRFMRMTISPLAEGRVQFETTTLRVENCLPQQILRTSTAHSDKMAVICSWCNKIKTAPDEWHEVVRAVKILGLFDLETPPTLSHGICGPCYDKAMETITEKNQQRTVPAKS